jgi:hypothetical protein
LKSTHDFHQFSLFHHGDPWLNPRYDDTITFPLILGLPDYQSLQEFRTDSVYPSRSLAHLVAQGMLKSLRKLTCPCPQTSDDNQFYAAIAHFPNLEAISMSSRHYPAHSVALPQSSARLLKKYTGALSCAAHWVKGRPITSLSFTYDAIGHLGGICKLIRSTVGSGRLLRELSVSVDRLPDLSEVLPLCPMLERFRVASIVYGRKGIPPRPAQESIDVSL